MRSPLPAGLLACGALLLSSCGGDETTTAALPATTTSTGATGATGAGGAPGPAGVGDVAACLDDAGFDATPDDSELIGVDAPYDRLDVPQDDLEAAAVILVFASDRNAKAQQRNVGAAAGLSGVKVAGNAVYGFDSAADFSPAEELVIKGCLPSG